jgi:hypothetical protein
MAEQKHSGSWEKSSCKRENISLGSGMRGEEHLLVTLVPISGQALHVARPGDITFLEEINHSRNAARQSLVHIISGTRLKRTLPEYCTDCHRP